MDDIITWVDKYSAAITAVATVVLVGVTYWYARLTRNISKAAQRSADAAKETADAARATADAGKEGADIASETAAAAKLSAQHAERAANTAERGLLANIMPLLVTDFSAGTDRRDVVLHNFGSSPALNAVMHCAGTEIPLGRVDIRGAPGQLPYRPFDLPSQVNLDDLHDQNGVAVFTLDYEDAIGNQYHTVCKHHSDTGVPHYETFLRHGDELQSLSPHARRAAAAADTSWVPASAGRASR